MLSETDRPVFHWEGEKDAKEKSLLPFKLLNKELKANRKETAILEKMLDRLAYQRRTLLGAIHCQHLIKLRYVTYDDLFNPNIIREKAIQL
jgi:hypothetical protein